MCPACSNEDEIWIQKGKVQPISTIHCVKCSGLYDPSEFIIMLLRTQTKRNSI
jgi:Zn ribbon nucleic-acid-binding protein